MRNAANVSLSAACHSGDNEFHTFPHYILGEVCLFGPTDLKFPGWQMGFAPGTHADPLVAPAWSAVSGRVRGAVGENAVIR